MLATSLVGLPALVMLVRDLITAPGPARPMLCAALSVVLIVGELYPIPVARGDDAGDEVSISSTVGLALAFIAPPGAAALAQAIALTVDEARSRRSWHRLAFNIAQYTLAVLAAREVYDLVSGLSLDRRYSALPPQVILAGLLGGAAFYVVNNGAIGVAVALKLRVSIIRQLVSDLRGQIVTSGVLLALAPPATVLLTSHPWSLPLILLPLAAVHRSAQLAYAREHEALHDSLTGLANRTLFNSRLDRAQREDLSPAVLLIDIDHFKEINDTLGHHAGDELLIALADRLRAAIRPGDLVARLGGDEFAVLVLNVNNETDAAPIVERIRGSLHQSVSISGVRIDSSASIGVALASGDDSPETLLRRADVAMYAAKRSRGTVQFYEATSDEHTVERLTLLGELREAADRGEIYLVYQPKISLVDGSMVGVEGLARWRHPVYGDLPPMRFIPLAENAGLIDDMTRHLLVQGLDQLVQWQFAHPSVGLAINVSARTLADREFGSQVDELLAARSLPPELLTLEVTESSLMEDIDSSVRVLDDLRARGIRVAIDDFGTGYSSLAYLKRIRADELKVDRSFVQRLATDPQDEVIVGMTIRLGHEFGLSVVAEGVEDGETADVLARLGCDLIQGYHVARPMPAEAVTAWHAAWDQQTLRPVG